MGFKYLAYFDYDKLWISFLIDKLRVGYVIDYNDSYYLDFYYNEHNITEERLIYLKKIASDNEGLMLTKGMVFSMLNLDEDEFIQESIRRSRRQKKPYFKR